MNYVQCSMKYQVRKMHGKIKSKKREKTYVTSCVYVHTYFTQSYEVGWKVGWLVGWIYSASFMQSEKERKKERKRKKPSFSSWDFLSLFLLSLYSLL